MAVPLLCIQLGVTVYEDDFVDDVVVSGMYNHDAASPVFESVGSPSLVSTYSPRGRVIAGPSRGMSARRRLCIDARMQLQQQQQQQRENLVFNRETQRC